MAQVIPAILEKEFVQVEKKIRLVENHVKWVQIDIADNSLMPNTTFLDPSPFGSLHTPVSLELHMMVKDPLRYLDKFFILGFQRFFAHVEGEFVEEFIAEGQKLGVEVGLAIDGPTNLKAVRPYLGDIDALLILAIEAGFSGRPFREETVDRVREISNLSPELPIAVDGAMDDVNAAKVIAAGATRINSNSYLFQGENIAERINILASLGNLRNPV